ncbi:unnamed protein product [Cyclocybe aegerita]|uniref:Uncharacterized protein n=1 Tax=Cyclocybe aegerita TaxID=1973307 RepID=A0A8S0XH86_CYCAE|nr:unnamed protein product [Cyclocybe aegerita]
MSILGTKDGLPCLRVRMSRPSVPSRDCSSLELITMSFLTMCLSLDNLLFYIRVCAVYCKKRSVVIFFGGFWLEVVCTAALITPTLSEAVVDIRPTSSCLEFAYKRSMIPANIVVLLYGMFVCVATSYRFYQSYRIHDASLPKALKKRGFGLDASFLQDHPIPKPVVLLCSRTLEGWYICYYTFGLKLLITRHLAPDTVILENTLTCRVFRNTKLVLATEPTDLGTLRFGSSSILEPRSRAGEATQCPGPADGREEGGI